jgi:hypothetical protein
VGGGGGGGGRTTKFSVENLQSRSVKLNTRCSKSNDLMNKRFKHHTTAT